MSAADVRIGVIGRGFGARVVAPVFDETEGCTVVDVVSPRDETAVGDLCGRQDLDLVAVHSPPFLHRDHVLHALEGGHAVLCDKPFGRSAADALAMRDAAVATDALNLLNFEFRHDPGREELRKLVLDGAVGDVEHVQWSVFSAGSRVPLRQFGWLFDAARGGGWIGAWGSHAIDFLRWTFGDITDARAELRTTIRERPDAEGRMHECTAEDAFTASLQTERGVSITIDTTFVAPMNLPGRITVIGSHGVLESRADQRITLRSGERREEIEIAPSGDGDVHLVPMRRWAVVVRDAVRGGAIPEGEPTFADGVACAQVMDALRRPR
jgi:predicted dehydrogenase